MKFKNKKKKKIIMMICNKFNPKPSERFDWLKFGSIKFRLNAPIGERFSIVFLAIVYRC